MVHCALGAVEKVRRCFRRQVSDGGKGRVRPYGISQDARSGTQRQECISSGHFPDRTLDLAMGRSAIARQAEGFSPCPLRNGLRHLTKAEARSRPLLRERTPGMCESQSSPAGPLIRKMARMPGTAWNFAPWRAPVVIKAHRGRRPAHPECALTLGLAQKRLAGRVARRLPSGHWQ